MATISKVLLSGSTNGRGIKVTTVGPLDGSDTTIHATGSSAGDWDLLTLYAYNDDTVARKLYLGMGGVTIPDDQIIMQLPPQGGLTLIVHKFALERNTLSVVASAEVANKIVVSGSVDRIDN